VDKNKIASQMKLQRSIATTTTDEQNSFGTKDDAEIKEHVPFMKYSLRKLI
jgi:hypothetical protein